MCCPYAKRSRFAKENPGRQLVAANFKPVDRRNALHFAQVGLCAVVKKLLERSAVNAEEAKAKEAVAESTEGKNTESPATYNADASAVDVVVITDEDSDAPDAPDALEVDAVDWHDHFSAPDYAVASGSPPVVEILLTAGANLGLLTIPKRL